MLGRLIVKLLFKACVPLVAVAGVMTYGLYLKGGDPAGLWKQVASGAFDKAGDMFSQAKDDAVGLAGNLTSGSNGTNGMAAGSGSTEVFTWKDAQGVTHFGTTAPVGIAASTVTVDPDVNVLAPVTAPGSRNGASDKAPTDKAAQLFAGSAVGSGNASSANNGRPVNQAVQELEAQMGEPLPGVAGQLLSGGAAGGNGMDPSQLIRMLQSGGN